jgi:hypothetical protein
MFLVTDHTVDGFPKRRAAFLMDCRQTRSNSIPSGLPVIRSFPEIPGFIGQPVCNCDGET